MRVLVVGGGDSAVEAAASIAESTDALVTLSYRGDAFTRAKAKNRKRVEQAAAAKRLRVALESEVRRIDRSHVLIAARGRELELPNDAVIVNAGGVLPTHFLRDIGVDVQTKYGTA
jgi:thioredoxin reductase